MNIKDAVKTKSKVFSYNAEPTNVFVSDGTLWPTSFDLGEMTLVNNGDIETGIEELEGKWQHVTEVKPEMLQRLISFVFGDEGQYILYSGSNERIIG